MSRMKTVRAALLAVLTTAVAVFAAPSPSMADGDNYHSVCTSWTVRCQTGVEVVGPAGVCDTANADNGSTIVCVDYYGDYVYVKDNDADGRSAMGFVSAENGIAYRYCRNPHGAGSWAKCNFDWAEAGGHAVRAGTLPSYSAEMRLQRLWTFYDN
ncbi:hypothetical protein GCM10022225_65720 [Plantactinospora mayteni]|uniref:Secreted protein n=1 Tax=Plantactinospora mayteni TaxID=566021 RepID=A0ABQ4EPS1_9ACTN|nr:hypothetical protein [Plantactinospora mayteni]GIG96647.1 hypothetical protein Pma05_32200 [Plantactinospora mayteni]